MDFLWIASIFIQILYLKLSNHARYGAVRFTNWTPNMPTCIISSVKVVVKTLIQDESGRILVLIRSSTHPQFAHHPDFPGGYVEQCETYRAAAIRELEEEVGIRIADKDMTEVYRRDAENEFLHIVYLAELKNHSPIIAISWEHAFYSWKTTEEIMATDIPNKTDPYYLTVLKYLKSKK